MVVRIERAMPSLTLYSGIAAVALVGILDVFTSTTVSSLPAYLLLVMLATWYSGRWSGVLISIASAVTWYLADLCTHEYTVHPAIPLWNACGRLITFLLFNHLLAQWRLAHQHECELARTDPLTGIANRRVFLESLNREITRVQRYPSAFTVVCFDLDHFKQVNDRLGHAAGDALLRVIASAVQRHIRASDLVARLGGDEFAILLLHDNTDSAAVVLGKLMTHLTETIAASGFPVTISMGAVICDTVPNDLQRVMCQADHLMYSVKANGRNGVQSARYSAMPDDMPLACAKEAMPVAARCTAPDDAGA